MSDYLAKRVLPDGRGLWVVPLTYGRARLHIGALGAYAFDDGW